MKNIAEQIGIITDSLAWIKQNRPFDEYERRFLELVPKRCELKTIQDAMSCRPAIAAYGESQKGKSYLMGNLLQNRGDSFKVRADGVEYDFVQAINPIGDKREATGVVTRFSSFIGHESECSDVYPARMKVLTVADLLKILSDSYHNDVTDSVQYSDDEYKEFTSSTYNKYVQAPHAQNFLTEDDIIGLEMYLEKFVAKGFAGLIRSGLLKKIAIVVRNIPESDWCDVFSILWHRNPDITGLFKRLSDCLGRLNYSRYIYLPIDAVLHKGDNKNTIMSVDCLNGLYSGHEVKYAEVFVPRAGSYDCLGRFNKSELCALCAEIAFKVDPDRLDDSARFFYDELNAGKPGYMSRAVYDRLDKTVSKKELFMHSDLLDFPGARSRATLRQEHLQNKNEESDVPNMSTLFLRGKVAFLFNHSNSSRNINILLFCHDNEQPSLTDMYMTLESWVNEYVGRTTEKRAETVAAAGGISPLFVIGTKFNIDMTQKANPEMNSPVALATRWEGRFMKVLYAQCFHAQDEDWFLNWTSRGSAFDNTFMLRDFKYSACDGQGNNLYEGFCPPYSNEEKKIAMDPDFYVTLKKSFVNNEHVAKLISDRDTCWDAAATLNNDGSLYIIQQLVKVSSKLDAIRENQHSDAVNSIMTYVRKLMKPYYIDPSISSLIPAKVKQTKSIRREMDFTCGEDNYFFGKLIQALQLEYKEVYKLVHGIVHSPELNQETHTAKSHELIREHIIGCTTADECYEKLMNVYGFDEREELEEFLSRRGVNKADIVPSTSSAKQKANSYVIAEKVYNYWIGKLKDSNFVQSLTFETTFDKSVMEHLIGNIRDTAEHFDLCSRMSKVIDSEVSTMAIVNEYIVSDMLLNVINNYVTDLGYQYRDEDDIENCRNIAKLNNLNLFNYIDQPRKSSYTEAELTEMFVEMTANPRAVTRIFMQNYSLWLEYVYVSILGGSDRVPKIENEAANAAVHDILKRLA